MQKGWSISCPNLFGYPVQDSLPAYCRSFAQECQKSSEEAERTAKTILDKSEESYNQHAHMIFIVGSHPVSNLWNSIGIGISQMPSH